jgi:hypothetical protein
MARSDALNNHESRTAKSRELRSPALCLRPLGVAGPCGSHRANSRHLAGKGSQTRPYHFAPLHSAPLATRHTRSPTAPRNRNAALPPRRGACGGRPPGPRSDSIALRFVIKTRLARSTRRSESGSFLTLRLHFSFLRGWGSAKTAALTAPLILACPAVPRPVPGSLLPHSPGQVLSQQGKRAGKTKRTQRCQPARFHHR